ncbi:hypothetical protein Tco_1364305 [Tanacetum coccineum]
MLVGEWNKICCDAWDRVRAHIKFFIGNGRKTMVWHDHWIGCETISKTINHRVVYKGRLDTNATVAEIYDDGKWLWPDGWLQRFLILKSTCNLSLDSNKDDKAVWIDNKNIQVHFSYAKRLQNQPVKDQLDSPSMVFPMHPKMFICNMYSSKIWSRLMSEVRILIPSYGWKEVVDFMKDIPKMNNIYSILRSLLLTASVYYIWLERNKILFQDEELNWDIILNKNKNIVRTKLSCLKVKKSSVVRDVALNWNIQ